GPEATRVEQRCRFRLLRNKDGRITGCAAAIERDQTERAWRTFDFRASFTLVADCLLLKARRHRQVPRKRAKRSCRICDHALERLTSRQWAITDRNVASLVLSYNRKGCARQI